MKIVYYPHPALRRVARPLTSIDRQIERTIAEMIDLMIEGKGLGLAGPQVALPYQIFVMNLEPEQRDMAKAFINPVIMERKGSVEGEEGCLSFPGLFGKVRRAKTIRYQAYDVKGQLQEGTVSDLEARVWQHEVDHLRGELFIDKMGPIAKMASRGEVKRFEREFRRAQERGEIPPDADLNQMLEVLERSA
ncbi:MAG TPA: peptide deformylase [Gemmataceae bacterium]|nr:peptide deformylase [Gemmataceae bacterium]